MYSASSLLLLLSVNLSDVDIGWSSGRSGLGLTTKDSTESSIVDLVLATLVDELTIDHLTIVGIGIGKFWVSQEEGESDEQSAETKTNNGLQSLDVSVRADNSLSLWGSPGVGGSKSVWVTVDGSGKGSITQVLEETSW